MKCLTAKMLLTLFFILIFNFSFAQHSDGGKIGENLPSAEDDSIAAYKKQEDFAYIHYLDSLLRKSNLKVDTYNINNAASSRRGKNNDRQTESSSSASTSINIFGNPFVRIFFWILAVVFISVILYKLFLADSLFKKPPAYVAEQQVEEEQVSDASVYDRMISQAATQKNFSLAVRYLYLQTLQMLSEKGLIQFSPDKTNYQYVRELSNKPYENDFTSITLHYEYMWYGKFEISEGKYKDIYTNFKTFQQKM